MRVAVVGSRGLKVEHLENYLPEGVTEIVSGGARGVDTCAREYALSHGLKLTEFLPEYLGTTAPFTPDGSGGGSCQNFPRYFPKMLANPQRIVCAFWTSRKKFFGTLHPLE